VGSLPQDCNEDAFKQLFDGRGSVSGFNFFGDRRFGFATFKSWREANETRTALDGSDLWGTRITVRFATEKKGGGYGGMPPNGDAWDGANGTAMACVTGKLHVGKLPYDTDEESFRRLFESYGRVSAVKVFPDRRFGFVTFEDTADAQVAFSALHNSLVQGSRITVRPAIDRPSAPREGQAMVPPAGPGTEFVRVDGLPASLTEEELKKIFANYAKVVFLRKTSSDEGSQTALWHIQVGEAEDATWLVDNVHGNIPLGLKDPVTVRYSSGLTEQRGAKKLSRERVTQEPVIGEIQQWCGNYGWITLQTPIDHPSARKQTGKLYVHQTDLVDGLVYLSPGSWVRCHVYADEKGLGAEQVSEEASYTGAATPATQGQPWPSQRQNQAATSAAEGEDWLDMLGDDRGRRPMANVCPSAPAPSASRSQGKGQQARSGGGGGGKGTSTASTEGGTRCKGQIKTFHSESQYGFIVSDAHPQDIFLPLCNVIGTAPLNVKTEPGEPPAGQFVEFELEMRGNKPRAVKVSLIGDAPVGAGTEAAYTNGAKVEAEDGFSLTTEQRTEMAGLMKTLPKDMPARVQAYLNSLTQGPQSGSL